LPPGNRRLTVESARGLGHDGDMPRLFVALDLPDACKQDLAGRCSGLPAARWVRDAQFHLTLRFIGEVEGPKAAEVIDALGSVQVEPFEMALKGVGHFPPRGQPRVVWAGVEAGDGLTLLQGRIERRLRRLGLKPESRKFSPHVSLARLKGTPAELVVQWLMTHGDLRSDPFPVRMFLLYSSVLGRGGSQFSVEAAYPLAAPSRT